MLHRGSYYICIWLTIACLLGTALGFFLGFSMFDTTLSLLRTPLPCRPAAQVRRV